MRTDVVAALAALCVLLLGPLALYGVGVRPGQGVIRLIYLVVPALFVGFLLYQATKYYRR